MTTATKTAKFEIGKTYSTRSACDHNCIFSWTVLERTAKFMKVSDKWGKVVRCGIQSRDGLETAYPNGRYSMAPQICAK